LAGQWGEIAHASGTFGAAKQCTAQHSTFVARNTTIDNATSCLFLDGSSIGISIPSTGGVTMLSSIVGYDITSGAVCRSSYRMTTIDGASGVLNDHQIHGFNGSGYPISVVTSGNTAYIEVNGNVGETIRWVAVIDTTIVDS
jgi:hypothetical protein